MDAFFSDLKAKILPCQIYRFNKTDLTLILNTKIFCNEISELYLGDIYFDDFNILFDSLELDSSSLAGKVSFIRSMFYYKLNNRDIDFKQVFTDFLEFQENGGCFLESETMGNYLLKLGLLKYPYCQVGDTLDLILPINGDTIMYFPRDSATLIKTNFLVKEIFETKIKKCDIEKKIYLTYLLEFVTHDELFFIHKKTYKTGDTISVKLTFNRSNSAN